jgi:hypothetical protein
MTRVAVGMDVFVMTFLNGVRRNGMPYTLLKWVCWVHDGRLIVVRSDVSTTTQHSLNIPK